MIVMWRFWFRQGDVYYFIGPSLGHHKDREVRAMTFGDFWKGSISHG